MRFDIITIFPNFFESFKNEALISRAQKKKLITINSHNLRDWTDDNHKTVDDKPYGGGAGMVLMIEPIIKAVETTKKVYSGQWTVDRKKLKTVNPEKASGPRGFTGCKLKTRVIVFSPKGKKFNQAMARKFSKLDQVIMICGRYEGVDERAAKYVADEELSIGDYVLFGGEVPAMVIIEAVTRLLPGAVGKQQSIEDESFKEAGGIVKDQIKKFLEYPHYTRPETIKINGKVRKVPKVLLSGNHKKIEEWREKHKKILTT